MKEGSTLMTELVDYLLPIKRKMDSDARPLFCRTITLNPCLWPKHYEKGIMRCLGFDIEWKISHG